MRLLLLLTALTALTAGCAAQPHNHRCKSSERVERRLNEITEVVWKLEIRAAESEARRRAISSKLWKLTTQVRLIDGYQDHVLQPKLDRVSSYTDGFKLRLAALECAVGVRALEEELIELDNVHWGR